MTLTVTVHRGTRQIGGSCIEIAAAGGDRLILDAGRPLDGQGEAADLLPATLDLSRPATVLISHPHQDHWGLLPALPASWPVWTGQTSSSLMRLSAELFGTLLPRPFDTWSGTSGPLRIGGFTVTPFLTDHSAPDAYMLLIERDGQRILYSGDFRTHGRKGTLVERFLAAPPADIDVLLMEGTNLRSGKAILSEQTVEHRLLEVAHETAGRLFVDWSAQNIDRTVSLYRTARRQGTKLIIDLYTADVMLRMPVPSGIPRPGADMAGVFLVIITPRQKWLYERMGRGDFVRDILATGVATSRRREAECNGGIVMARRSLLADYAQGGLAIGPTDTFIHSNWRGYLDEADQAGGWARAKAIGARREVIHTSGHASPDELARFAGQIAPRFLVPVHGVAWDDPGIVVPPVRRLDDGEPWLVPPR